MSPEMPQRRSRLKLAIAAAALLLAGGAAGAFAIAETRPTATMAPATPVAIRALAPDGIVTVRGRVAEVYGNKFVIADATGRALVDTGRGGETGLVKANDPITVQGRFDDGFIHAAFLVTPGGKVTALGPIGGHRHGHHDEDREEREAGADRSAPPPAAPAAPDVPAQR